MIWLWYWRPFHFTLTFPYSLSELFWLQYVWAFSLAFRLCSSLYGAFIDFLITFCSLPLLTELYDFLNTTRKEKAAVCWQRLFSLVGKPYQQFVYGVHGTVSFCLYLLISPLHKAMPNHSGFHRLKRDFLLSPRLHCFRNATQAKGEWVNLTVGFCVIAPVLLY